LLNFIAYPFLTLYTAENCSHLNAIPIGRGGGRDWPIRILDCHLTYRLNLIWHGILGLKLLLQVTILVVRMPFQLGGGRGATDQSESSLAISHIPSQSYLTWHSGTKVFASDMLIRPNPHCFIALTKATACGWKEPLLPHPLHSLCGGRGRGVLPLRHWRFA
jgi:hypothetical protein